MDTTDASDTKTTDVKGKGLEYILQLSVKYGVSQERTIAMYEHQYAELNVGANVKDFVPLLAAKAVEAAIRAERKP